MSKLETKVMVNSVMTSAIDVMDRGFQYGDGLFETMRITNQKISLWQKHWQRLSKGCEVLSIKLPDKIKIEHDINSTIAGVSTGILKLIVTRGVGGRGYVVREELQPEIILILSDLPVYPDSYTSDGVSVRYCNTQISQQPVLAGVKHLNRLEQVMARNEWKDSDIAEGLMLDAMGNIIEGTMTNIFMSKDDRVFTPQLDFCGVAGVMRETVLSILKEENIPYEVTKISKKMLNSADEVFLTNSVIGLWPVKSIGDTVYSVGNISKMMQQKINNKIKNA